MYRGLPGTGKNSFILALELPVASIVHAIQNKYEFLRQPIQRKNFVESCQQAK